jgi:hypothetical protein
MSACECGEALLCPNCDEVSFEKPAKETWFRSLPITREDILKPKAARFAIGDLVVVDPDTQALDVLEAHGNKTFRIAGWSDATKPWDRDFHETYRQHGERCCYILIDATSGEPFGWLPEDVLIPLLE